MCVWVFVCVYTLMSVYAYMNAVCLVSCTHKIDFPTCVPVTIIDYHPTKTTQIIRNLTRYVNYITLHLRSTYAQSVCEEFLPRGLTVTAHDSMGAIPLPVTFSFFWAHIFLAKLHTTP